MDTRHGWVGLAVALAACVTTEEREVAGEGSADTSYGHWADAADGWGAAAVADALAWQDHSRRGGPQCRGGRGNTWDANARGCSRIWLHPQRPAFSRAGQMAFVSRVHVSPRELIPVWVPPKISSSPAESRAPAKDPRGGGSGGGIGNRS